MGSDRNGTDPTLGTSTETATGIPLKPEDGEGHVLVVKEMPDKPLAYSGSMGSCRSGDWDRHP